MTGHWLCRLAGSPPSLQRPFYVTEVIAAHAAFVIATWYELLEQDPRGGIHRGPRWLAVYEITDEQAAEQYVKDRSTGTISANTGDQGRAVG